ncbi:M3 family oligoendopeptidase [Candidatus Pacearchaeota archaeon]|nr:M3 family oligoendopeptidase [Candidatus Pacearchaeota archaeon]
MVETNISLTKWNLEPISGKSKTFEEQRKEWFEIADVFIKKWKNREDYLNEIKALKEALDYYEKFLTEYGTEPDELYYYYLLNSLNQNDAEIKAKLSKIEDLSLEIANKINFFELSLSKISKENQEKFLASEKLKDYRNFLKKIFTRSKYLLSENEEKIMNLKSRGSYQMWKKMVSEFVFKEEIETFDESENLVKKTFEDLLGLLKSPNKRVRDKAAEGINEILEKHSDVAEAELNAILENKKINDLIRGYERPDKSVHLNDELESEIVDTLVESVKEKFEISKRYYKLKANLMGVEKLKYHERIADYGKLPKEYDFEESVKLVKKVFSDLDNEFVEIFQKFLENRQVDVYPKKGKRGGAFCIYSLKRHPVYVMLNHTGKLNDVLTIAHEFGHAINNEFMRKKQNSLNFSTPFSTAETASTFMEDFVLAELLKEADDETKLTIIMQKLDSDVATIFRQIACDLFQRELHEKFREKGFLSKKEIGKLFQKHMSAYMGDYVKQSKGSENWWVYWSHIRKYFYNYQYSFGLLVSKALQKKTKENQKFIEKVKEFFSTGVSKSPREIFSEMEIDISKKEFWKQGILEVEELLSEAENLARKLNKI